MTSFPGMSYSTSTPPVYIGGGGLPTPRLLGGATTRGQRRGDPATRRALEGMAAFLGKKLTHRGRPVNDRTTRALHKFASMYGNAVAKVEILGDRIRELRRGGATSRELRALTGEKRRADGKLKKLNNWYNKQVKSRIKTHGQHLQEALKTALGASQSFMDAAVSLLPTFSFQKMWNSLTAFFRGGPRAAPASHHGRSVRDRRPRKRLTYDEHGRQVYA